MKNFILSVMLGVAAVAGADCAYADSTIEVAYEVASETNFADPIGYLRFERQLAGGEGCSR